MTNEEIKQKMSQIANNILMKHAMIAYVEWRRETNSDSVISEGLSPVYEPILMKGIHYAMSNSNLIVEEFVTECELDGISVKDIKDNTINDPKTK